MAGHEKTGGREKKTAAAKSKVFSSLVTSLYQVIACLHRSQITENPEADTPGVGMKYLCNKVIPGVTQKL